MVGVVLESERCKDRRRKKCSFQQSKRSIEREQPIEVLSKIDWEGSDAAKVENGS